MNRTEQAYQWAKERYAALGVDTGAALSKLDAASLSLHCWQADDVGGFEHTGGTLGGGLAATGNYPGKARNIDELRKDMEKVYSLLPGKHRFSIHAMYGDFGGKPADRDALEPAHFRSWVEWARSNDLALDFNSTFFSHAKAADGFTLSHTDAGIRSFWIEHGRRCREISDYIGGELGKTCIHNIWIPDGSKDITTERYARRRLLEESLDEILKTRYPEQHLRDSVESKLFGIGSEAFVVGSHEFYLGYAITRSIMLTLDIGHFHPTESVADKVSSVFCYLDSILFHITRGLRWDSDHVVTLNDPVREIMQEIVWSGKLDKVYLGLDYFDASINRIGAYVAGARATLKALLLALLDPLDKIREYEDRGQYFQRLALLEEARSMPFGAVWDYYCLTKNVPVAGDYIAEIVDYEKKVTSRRG
jgi:L-rhamnose isomerase